MCVSIFDNGVLQHTFIKNGSQKYSSGEGIKRTFYITEIKTSVYIVPSYYKAIPGEWRSGLVRDGLS